MKITVSDGSQDSMIITYPSGAVEMWGMVEGEWDFLTQDNQPTREEVQAIEATSEEYLSVILLMAQNSAIPLEFEIPRKEG
jgi:hypothetical protein